MKNCYGIDPRGQTQSRPVVITNFTHFVRRSVLTCKSEVNITAGRMRH